MLFIFLQQIGKMKKVFLETHNIKNPATGLGTFNYGLIKGLSHQDLSNVEITISAYKPQSLKDEFKDTFKYKKVYSFNRYKAFSVSTKHDLWHSVNQNTKFEPSKVSKYLLTIHDVNFVDQATIKDCSSKRGKLFYGKLERCHAITYISEFAKQHTHQYFDVPNVPEYVIYNGNPITVLTDTSNYLPEFPVDKPFLYTIGDFLEKKNFESIVRMMQFVPDFNLILSGNNNKPAGDKIREAITELKLQDRVFLTGKVSDAGKQFYLKNCAAFLFPSVGEGFGLPPIEAMRFGKPVFLANRASLPEIGGEQAFYWDEFDPEHMALEFYKGFGTYKNNVAFYEEKLTQRALSFNWDDAAKQYLDVYHSLLK